MKNGPLDLGVSNYNDIAFLRYFIVFQVREPRIRKAKSPDVAYLLSIKTKYVLVASLHTFSRLTLLVTLSAALLILGMCCSIKLQANAAKKTAAPK